MRKPLRRLKIQDQLEVDEELNPDFIDDNEELTLLSAINCIVTHNLLIRTPRHHKNPGRSAFLIH